VQALRQGERLLQQLPGRLEFSPVLIISRTQSYQHIEELRRIPDLVTQLPGAGEPLPDFRGGIPLDDPQRLKTCE
jgi:hypothetical protein